jgi:NAD(P) transhydrogenase subunit alpha
MSVTNAISSVIIVGAVIASFSSIDGANISFSNILGFFAVTLASINIFGGFLVTQRMLQMYKKKEKKKNK